MTKIFGHRGSAGTHPENTMISFEQAYLDGADGIELDVQLSKDGIPVVIHDEKVDRTTDSKGFVQDMTLKELQNLNAVYKFTDKYKNAKIPTLEEVLSFASNKNIFINIELKNGIIAYEGLEEKVIALVEQYKLQAHIIFSSFNHYSIAKLHVLVPDIEKAVLYMEGIYKPWEYTRWVGAQSIHPNIKACPAELIERSQTEGVPVRPFTVNDEVMMRKLFEMKCAGFFTDYPKRAVELKK